MRYANNNIFSAYGELLKTLSLRKVVTMDNLQIEKLLVYVHFKEQQAIDFNTLYTQYIECGPFFYTELN